MPSSASRNRTCKAIPMGRNLIKPHGSTNWFRVNERVEELTPAQVIQGGGLVDPSMPVTMTKDEPKPGWLPALAVPTTSSRPSSVHRRTSKAWRPCWPRWIAFSWLDGGERNRRFSICVLTRFPKALRVL
jgi:hypothetical protein